MEVRRLLPILLGLVVLAFALGSLPRGSPSGSLLFQSYWLLYLIYLGPVAILGIILALIIIIGMNWRDLGTGIGFGMARRRMRRKPKSRLAYVVYGLFWALAIGVLIIRKGSIFNPDPQKESIVTAIVGTNGGSGNPIPATLSQTISGLIDNSWFGVALLGLLLVGGLVLVQAVRVSLKETSQLYSQDIIGKQEEGLRAVHDAIRIVDDKEFDARSRIISCYQHLVRTVSRLGAPTSQDQTARELEAAIRSTFLLKGTATSNLTKLFEEARYSLHEIADEDAATAHNYLRLIAEELQVKLDSEP